MEHYKVREQEILFVLKDQLNYGRLCRYDRYKDLTETAFDMVVKEAVNFAHGVIEPLLELSEDHGVKYQEDGTVQCHPAYGPAFKKCGEDGWIAVARDPELGGQGFPLMMRIIVNEFFYGACQSFNVLPSLTHGAGHLIEAFGTERLKNLFVPRMYGGEWSGAMALTEPDAGSNLAALQTSARSEGDHFKIKGNKIFITYGVNDVAANNINLVLARIEGAPEGIHGISLFVVPKIRVNEDGTLGDDNDVRCQRVEQKMGIRGAPTEAISFGDHDECIGYLCGEENKGLAHMFQMINQGRINSAVTGMTLASTAYLNVLQYCKERIQGAHIAKRKTGDVPLIDHPDIRRMLLWMKSVVEGLRSMIYLTAFHSDLARCETDPSEKERYRLLLEFTTPIVKAYSTHMGFEVCSNAMQCMGGHGYMKDYPIENYLRDVRGPALYEGTNGIQALDLLRRKMTMKGGAALKCFVDEIQTFTRQHTNHEKLSQEMKKLETTLLQLQDVSLWLASKYAVSPEKAAGHAFPLLLCCGDVMLAWRLLDMAVIAYDAMPNKGKKRNFYQGKIAAATYFIRETLPQTRARLSTCLGENNELLEMDVNDF